MAFEEFPKMYYCEGKEPVTVNSADEAKALGKGWSTSPVSVPVEDQTKVIGLNMPTPMVDATANDGADPKNGADPVKGVK